MGNEDKINHIVTKSKSEFLPRELPFDEGPPMVYSLAEEFARTKKNRNPLFHLFIVGFLALIIGATYFITYEIQKSLRKSDTIIADFEDLHLKDILDSAKRYEKDLDRYNKELDDLRKAMSDQLYTARTNQQQKDIRATYGNLIAEKQRKIDDTMKKKAQYDTRLKETMAKAQAMVDYYQKLHQMKMAAQRQEYQAKMYRTIMEYNPIFKSREEKTALKGTLSAADPSLKVYRDELAAEKVLSREEFDALRMKLKNLKVLTDRMLKIPYKNSVKPALKNIDGNQNEIINTYEKLWNDLVRVVRTKNRLLKNYSTAFNYLSKTNIEGGYVVDPTDLNKIHVYINAIHTVREGDTGMVFNSEEELIGKISFYISSDGLKAKLIERQANKQMEPFDRILINKVER